MRREVAEAKLRALGAGARAGARALTAMTRGALAAPIGADASARGARASAATRCSRRPTSRRFAGTPHAELDALRAIVERRCRPTRYLRDGGRYRRRRHSSFVVDGGAVRAGGAPRALAAASNTTPCTAASSAGSSRSTPGVGARAGVARACSERSRALASRLTGAQPWYVEAHQFRIDTTDGIGRPTPEGAHRDGVDLVAVVLVGREGIKGGETRVFDADGPAGMRFTLLEPWTALFLDDARVIHETHADPAARGRRPPRHAGGDLRAGGFQGPTAAPT